MKVRVEVGVQPGMNGVEMEVVRGWLNGEECVIGMTTIDLLDERGMGVQRLLIAVDLAVKP